MKVEGVGWMLLWLLILLLLAWPIGAFCGLWYLLLSPLAACLRPCMPLVDLLESGFKLPLTCSQNLVKQKPIF